MLGYSIRVPGLSLTQGNALYRLEQIHGDEVKRRRRRRRRQRACRRDPASFNKFNKSDAHLKHYSRLYKNNLLANTRDVYIVTQAK